MSITFSPDDAPRTEDTVYECECNGENPTCYDCKGTGEIRFKNYLFECNFSNANAWDFTKFMTKDGDPDYCGRVEPDRVHKVLDRLERARRHCDHMGWATDRLDRLINTFLWAAANHKGVNWG